MTVWYELRIHVGLEEAMEDPLSYEELEQIALIISQGQEVSVSSPSLILTEDPDTNMIGARVPRRFKFNGIPS